jgi:hypothetical protein
MSRLFLSRNIDCMPWQERLAEPRHDERRCELPAPQDLQAVAAHAVATNAAG